MPNQVAIPVDDPDALLLTDMFGAGALIRVERSSTGGGAGFTEIGTEAIASGTTLYEHEDATGITGDYYRWRFSNAGGTRLSDYSDEVRAGGDSAYASVADLEELLPDTNVMRDRNFLWDALIAATNYISDECGRDFFRHPQVSGTESRILRTVRGDRLIVNAGIVSLTTVEYAASFGDDWTALGAENTDWYLDDPVTTRTMNGEEITSYFSVRLPSNGTLTTWYAGPRRARLTGVFGWSDIPSHPHRGALALAREFVARKLTSAGGPTGDEGFGPITPLPNETYRAIVWGRRMHFGRA